MVIVQVEEDVYKDMSKVYLENARLERTTSLAFTVIDLVSLAVLGNKQISYDTDKHTLLIEGMSAIELALTKLKMKEDEHVTNN